MAHDLILGALCNFRGHRRGSWRGRPRPLVYRAGCGWFNGALVRPLVTFMVPARRPSCGSCYGLRHRVMLGLVKFGAVVHRHMAPRHCRGGLDSLVLPNGQALFFFFSRWADARDNSSRPRRPTRAQAAGAGVAHRRGHGGLGWPDRGGTGIVAITGRSGQSGGPPMGARDVITRASGEDAVVVDAR